MSDYDAADVVEIEAEFRFGRQREEDGGGFVVSDGEEVVEFYGPGNGERALEYLAVESYAQDGGVVFAHPELEDWLCVESREKDGSWRVESSGPDAVCYVTWFGGPRAQQRAIGYAACMNRWRKSKCKACDGEGVV